MHGRTEYVDTFGSRMLSDNAVVSGIRMTDCQNVQLGMHCHAFYFAVNAAFHNLQRRQRLRFYVQ